MSYYAAAGADDGAGRHTQTRVEMAELPLDIAVEVEMIGQVRD